MNKLIYILLAVCVSSFAVAQDKPTTLRLDISNPYGGPASGMFDSVVYIPLETNTASLFGDIDKLVITDNAFIILDRSTNGIYTFTRSGRFIAKILGRKNNIHDFNFDFKHQSISVESSNKDELMDNKSSLMKEIKTNPLKFYETLSRTTKVDYYAITGEKIASPFPCNPLLSFLAHMNIPLPDDGYCFSYELLSDPMYPDTVVNKINVFKDGKLYKGYFPYNLKYNAAIANGGEIKVSDVKPGEPINVTIPFDYAIYQLSRDELVCKYQLVFPAANTISKDYIKDSSMTRASADAYFQTHLNIVASIGRVYIQDQLIYLNLTRAPFRTNGQSKLPYNIVYSQTSQKVYDFSKIDADSSTYYLPFYSWEIHSYDKKHFYASVPSSTLFQTYNITKEKHPAYPPVLRKYFTEQNRNANPVIVFFKFKDNL